jgi:hypothetical protein
MGCATIAGLDEDFAREPTCNRIVPPSAPSVKNAGDTIEFTTAIRTIDLDEEDDDPRFGFDLDNKCSCTTDGSSCKRPAYVDANKEICDDVRGLDNGTGVALARINALASGAISSILINEGTSQGAWSILIRVRNYSGTANDDRVSVALYETPGMATAPAWDGTDSWPISNTTVGSTGTVDEPANFDDKAYVHDGILVAHIPKTKLLFRSTRLNLPLDLFDWTISAKIVPANGDKWRLTEGTVAAKWSHPALFKGLSEFRYDENLEKKLCRDDIIYLQVKNLFCSSTDILENPAAGESTECNAISFGMRFDTETAQLGMVTAPLPPPDPLCNVNFDPVSDVCAKP